VRPVNGSINADGEVTARHRKAAHSVKRRNTMNELALTLAISPYDLMADITAGRLAQREHNGALASSRGLGFSDVIIAGAVTAGAAPVRCASLGAISG
jgi:hypothetical protein